MRSLLKILASLRLTLVGLVWLILNAFAVSQWPDAAIPWLALPLALLALNLLAAIVVNGTFRHQSALLVFHVGLLGVLILVAAGVLVRFDGQVELVEGERFDPAAVKVTSRGWLHPGRMENVDFSQGPVEVRYTSGLRRDTTHSTLNLSDDGNSHTFGDRQGFSSHGYRFMTTPNKGFSVLLLWEDVDGNEGLGAVNFPSYPEFEWKQQNEWTTPSGEQLTLELDLKNGVPEDSAWVLNSDVEFELLVRKEEGETLALALGDTLSIAGGRITVADLRLGMGYRIDFNPLLSWLLAAAFLSLGALTIYVQEKFRTPRSSTVVAPGRQQEA